MNIVRYDKSKRPIRFLMINLAIADFILIFTNIPVALINSIQMKWLFGQIGKYLKIKLTFYFNFFTI